MPNPVSIPKKAEVLRTVSLAFALVLCSPCPGHSFSPPCEFHDRASAEGEVRQGYVEFLPEAELRPLKEALPRVADSRLQGWLKSSDTMWYDEQSMVFLYQDSIEFVVGARANCVGRKLAEQSQHIPSLANLIHLFGDDNRFTFPFRKAAGTDNARNVRVVNFWVPPRKGNMALPVRWWKRSPRGRWEWVFPVGTVFGEVLYQQSPRGRWLVFEIRTRERYRDGWAVDLFRPFPTALHLADAIMARRPGWAMEPNLRRVVRHLENPATLVPHRMESPAFAKVFPAIEGALDPIPEIEDVGLIEDLLSETRFVSTEGEIWKEHGGLETYAPASRGGFSVVPPGYEMGLIPVNEVSCNRCHSETGRRLADFDRGAALYGEIWGEDRIFTWHLFEPHERIYGPWDDRQGSRTVNPRMRQAGLLLNEKPSSTDPDYGLLPSAFPSRK